MKDVLHDWDDERCLHDPADRPRGDAGRRRGSSSSRRSRSRNVVEPVASFVDVHMLTQTDGGRQRSVAELHALLREAGLEPGEVRLTANPGLVEGVA